jgi:hypothetical protein
VSLTYFDTLSGRNRLKRRYRWACWGYGLGFISGALLVLILQ